MNGKVGMLDELNDLCSLTLIHCALHCQR